MSGTLAITPIAWQPAPSRPPTRPSSTRKPLSCFVLDRRASSVSPGYAVSEQTLRSFEFHPDEHQKRLGQLQGTPTVWLLAHDLVAPLLRLLARVGRKTRGEFELDRHHRHRLPV